MMKRYIRLSTLCLAMLLSLAALFSCGDIGADKNASYTVTFGHEDGTVENSQTVKYGEKLTRPEDPKKTGYIFDGWRLEGEKWDFSKNTVTKNLTLISSWKPTSVAVMFNPAGGKSPDHILVDYGSTLTDLPIPTREGYKFLGWYERNTIWNESTPVYGSLYLTAKWESLTVTASFSSAGGSNVPPQTVNTGACITKPTDPTKDNSLFLGWFYNDTLWDFSTPITENITLKAKWQPLTVTVTYDSNGGTTVASETVACGKKWTEPVAPEKHDNVFLGWYVGNTKWDFSSIPASNVVLTAKWQPLHVTVYYNSNGGSPVESQTVDYNTSATEPEEPTKLYHKFAGWYNGDEKWEFSAPLTDNVSLVAKWEQIEVTVTFDSNGGSSVPAQVIYAGTKVKLPQTPTNDNYYFDGWYFGDTKWSFTTIIAEDITLTAKWLTFQEYRWQNLATSMDEDTYKSLKKLYDFYDGDKIIDWMASLWDPAYGGFYYSNSARDYVGYLPDIESTHQIMGWLTANGAIADSNELNRKMPHEIKKAMVEFARNMQSSSNGYFYHPQWPSTGLQADRMGRDLSWATSMFNRFTVDMNGDGVEEKQYPKYCTPNGVKCQKHAYSGSCSYVSATSSGDGVGSIVAAASKSLTSALSTKVSSAVSRVKSSTVTAVVSSTPDYSSSKAFTAWLEEYNANIKNNSGRAHELNAMSSEIIAKGYGDEVVAYLNRIQTEIYNEQKAKGETPSGLWQYNADYRAVWGLLKYATFYNAAANKGGAEIKYVKEIVATCIKVIKLPPDGGYYMNDIYNQWSSINSLITNVKKYNMSALEDIYAMMRKDSSTLIDNSLAKITPYRNLNGAFGYTHTGQSLSYIYGVPISYGMVESDVNGTGLCCSMYRCIFTCLGYTAVPLCTSEDGDRFIKTISQNTAVEKLKAPKDNVITFTGGNMGGATLEKKTSSGAMSVINDPTNSSNKVLSFTSGKTTEKNSDRVKFTPLGNKDSCCYVFETKMYVQSSSASNNAYLFQIKMGDAYMITLVRNGNTVDINESNTTTTTNTTTVKLGSTSMNTWFKVRIEYYRPEYLGTKNPKIKIFINDKYVKTSELFFGSNVNGAAPKTAFDYVSFYSMRSFDTVILLDDCYFSREGKVYSSTSHTTSDYRQ